MTTECDSATPGAVEPCGVMEQSIDDSSSINQVNEVSTPSISETGAVMNVQLRPVSHVSAVTQLFEYALQEWQGQRGDHCTYRYMSTRDPMAPMEMISSVLVRLPDRAPLLVKDTKPRMSRVQAQNAVAQMALEKLAMDDAELAEKLEQIKRDVPPPPPVPPRYASSSAWRHNGSRNQQMPGYGYYQQPRQPFYGYSPYYPQVPRSTSAPEMMVDEYGMPTMGGADMMYYPMQHSPVLDGGCFPMMSSPESPSEEAAISHQVSSQSDGASNLITPTGMYNHHYYPFGYHPGQQFAAGPYMPTDMSMYYQQPVMVQESSEDLKSFTSGKTDSSTIA